MTRDLRDGGEGVLVTPDGILRRPVSHLDAEIGRVALIGAMGRVGVAVRRSIRTSDLGMYCTGDNWLRAG